MVAKMMDNNAADLQELLSHPQLWRARQLDAPGGSVNAPGGSSTGRIASGYATLDQALGDSGWPRGGLVELLADHPGIGELRLLAPALAALSRQEERWLLWINPPHIPYAPALAALGIDVDKVLLVHPRCHEDALWSLEQALKSGTCSAALGWFDERRLTVRDLRRLQLAARQGGTLTTLFRPRSAAGQASMAELRILLQPPQASCQPEIDGHTPVRGRAPMRTAQCSATTRPAPETAADNLLELEIIKRRGGWPRAPFLLQLQQPPAPLTTTELQTHIEGWRRRARHRQTAVSNVPAATGAGTSLTAAPSTAASTSTSTTTSVVTPALTSALTSVLTSVPPASHARLA